MLAVYDLATSPPQYDFAMFLVAAEIERIRRGEDGIDLVFAPGPNEGFRKRSLWPKTRAEHARLMAAIALPMATLLPSVRRVRWLADRDGIEGQFGTGEKLYGFPQHLRNLADPAGRPLVAPGSRRRDDTITITLREAEHLPVRNSAVEEWLAAARAIEARGWRVIFVRDTRMAGRDIGGFACDHAAAVDIVARARLYKAAALNLFVNSGPMALATYLNVPLLNFRPTCPQHAASSPEYVARCGFPVGSQLPRAPEWQRYVWSADRADLIVAAVEETMEAVRAA